MSPFTGVVMVAFCIFLIAIVWLVTRKNQGTATLPDSGPLASHIPTNDSLDDPLGHFDLHPLHSPLFQSVASSIDAGLVILDTERCIRFLNTQAEDLLGQERQFRENNGLITLLRDYQADSLVSDVLHDLEAREITIKLITSHRMLHLRCLPLCTDSCLDGALLIIRDVTQISLLERARRDMVANVSHELRSPLSSLKLLVETLQSEPPPDVARRMLGQMVHEIDAVTQLASELHELSQIESGRVSLQLSPHSVQTIVEQAIAHIQPQAQRKNIHILSNVPTDTRVLVDERRMEQVLINLFHNAVKFTSDQGTITVRSCEVVVNERILYRTNLDQRYTRSAPLPPTDTVRCLCPHDTFAEKEEQRYIPLPVSHPSGAWVITSLQDTGIGIPPQDIPRIFERFYKVDRSRTYSGTGLGLAVAKHLIEGHGGRLWVESEEGKGSTFYFSLPLA
jgi:two-component system, OmpR family, phosphate regulon sensor histidine kinase PhoR